MYDTVRRVLSRVEVRERSLRSSSVRFLWRAMECYGCRDLSMWATWALVLDRYDGREARR